MGGASRADAISIHAPTRGATYWMLGEPLYLYFNPRSHKRSDVSLLTENYGHAGFQSTLPQEERRRLMIIRVWGIVFQSTLPQEERRRWGLPWRPDCTDFNPRSHKRSDG